MRRFLAANLILCAFASVAQAVTVWNPLPLEAYTFGRDFPEQQELLFAFDYGHSLLYEKLIIAQSLDQRAGHQNNVDFNRIENETLDEIFSILKNPPNKKVDDEDIAPEYVYLFPWLSNIFDWSHLLHQFVYDVLRAYPGQDGIINRRVQELLVQYQGTPSARNIAIPFACKSMEFMDGHPYSKTFRETMPRYNQLIWAYHWFQMKLYEDMMQPTLAQQQESAAQTTALFKRMISNLPDSTGFDMMPMSKDVAPHFYSRFSGIAQSFDANHMLHDVINDLLISAMVVDKPAAGREAAQWVLDPKAFPCKQSSIN